MKRSGISLISAFLIVLVSCNIKETNTESTTMSDTIVSNKEDIASRKVNLNDTAQQLSMFYNSLAKSEWESVNNALAEDGCWILYADGAMPQFKKVYKLENFRNGSGKLVTEILSLESIMSVTTGTLPAKNCDTKSGYASDGVFYEPVNTLVGEHIWDYADMNEKERQELAAAANQVTLTFLNTDSYKFYFAMLNGKLKLVLIDIRKPCSA